MSHSQVLPHQVQRWYTREAGAHFKQSLPSADESVASMAQAATFICLARALTDLSVTNILERVMEEGGEEKKWGNNRSGGWRHLQTFLVVAEWVGGCISVCVYVFSYSLKQDSGFRLPLVSAWTRQCISGSCHWDVALRVSYTPTSLITFVI